VFSFHRGSLALDFVGTLGPRASAQPLERLPDAKAFELWLREAGLLDASHRAGLRAEDVSRAIEVREAIARVGNTLVDAGSPRANDIATINTAATGMALGVPFLNSDLSEGWKSSDPLGFALGRIASDAITIFGPERSRLSRCQGTCGTLVLSRARNEPRRWCSMEACGNRAKVAAHRARKGAT